MEKCTRDSLAGVQRGLLGRRPRTFGRLLKPASHRTSSRSKRNSYIRRRARAPEKSPKTRRAMKRPAGRANSRICTTSCVVNCDVPACVFPLSFPRSGPRAILMLRFAFRRDDSHRQTLLMHIHHTRGTLANIN